MKKKSPTQVKSKYDWPALKSKYLAGDVKDAAVFIRNELRIAQISGQHRKMTTGWARDWDANREKMAAKIVEKSNETMATRMAKALDGIRDYFEDKATNAKENLKVDDAKEVWRILRVENNLPNAIARQMVTVQPDPDDALDKLQTDDDRKIEVQDTPEIQDHK